MRFIKNISGATAIEFALVMPTFLLMLFGVFGFAQLFWIQSSIEQSLIVAGRYAMINSATVTSAQIRTAAQGGLPGVNPANVTYTATSTSSGGVTYWTINGTYSFTWLSLVPALSSFSVSETLNAPVPVGR